MAQFLRPDGTVSSTGAWSVTGAASEYEAVDETSASDSDYIQGGGGSRGLLDMSLSNPAATPGAGTKTIRYRYMGYTVSTRGAGDTINLTVGLYEGGVLVQEWVHLNPRTGFTTATQTVTGSVSNWNNVTLRFTTSGSWTTSGNYSFIRISWAEVEVPDAAAPSGTVVKVYNGSAWDTAAAKVWNGSSWDDAAVKIYNGTDWD